MYERLNEIVIGSIRRHLDDCIALFENSLDKSKFSRGDLRYVLSEIRRLPSEEQIGYKNKIRNALNLTKQRVY